MLTRVLRCLAGLPLIAAFALAAPETSQPRESPLQRTLRELQAIPPDYTNVPEASRPLLTRLKHQLRDLILAIVSSPEGRFASPDELTSMVLARLEAEGVSMGSDDATVEASSELEDLYNFPYYVSDIHIEQPSGHPELLAVRATLQLTCGDDTSLYVLERSGDRWRLVLAVEKNGYAEVSGAACLFEYDVSPHDECGAWYVVTADIHCWCTSTWQEIRYKVLRPGPSPYEPRVVFSEEHDMFIGEDPNFTLSMEPDGFSLRFMALQSLDMSIIRREHVRRFTIRGDAVKRVPPLAFKPEDFLDEWIDLPWNEASRWVEGAALRSAQRWHERLHSRKFRPSEFNFIQPCAERPGETQIGLTISKKELFFTIRERDGSYFLRYIGTTRPPGYPGERSPYEEPEAPAGDTAAEALGRNRLPLDSICVDGDDLSYGGYRVVRTVERRTIPRTGADRRAASGTAAFQAAPPRDSHCPTSLRSVT
jgi:hypothetical protein